MYALRWAVITSGARIAAFATEATAKDYATLVRRTAPDLETIVRYTND